MRMVTKTKVVDFKVFEANDGTEFSTENQCLEYERNKDKTMVFALIKKSYGRHGETLIGIFSTDLKAQNWINKWGKDQHRFFIRPEYVDGK